MPYTDIINVILPTFFTILVGFAIGKLLRFDVKTIIDVVFYTGLPALTFTSILNQNIVILEAAKIWGAAILVSIGCAALGWILFKILREKHSGLYLPISLPNTVNVPFPIITLAYGPAGLFFATLYYIPNVILLYSLGIYVAAGKDWLHNLKTMLKVPTLYAAILALVLNFNHVKVPTMVMNPLNFIGGMTIPIVVLTLGISLSRVKITSIPITLWSSLIRLGGGLAIGFLVAYLFDLTGLARNVVVLMSAMPAAVNTYTITEKYNNEPDLVASVVMVTTVASLLIIPFLLRILG